MHTRLIHTLPILAGLMLPAAALAQTTPPAPAAHDGHERGHWMEMRFQHLHDALKITPAQDASWKAFEDTYRENGRAMHAAMGDRMKAMSTMTAPELAKLHADRLAARAQGAQKIAAATETLYDSLSPEQKAAFDMHARDMAEHRMAHHWGRMR
jgi:Spy/CpxP family protein refolding chaperone